MQLSDEEQENLDQLMYSLRHGLWLTTPVLIALRSGTATTQTGATRVTHPDADWMNDFRREYAGQRVFHLKAHERRDSEISIRVGRARDCQVRVRSESVSRVHALIEGNIHENSFTITDQASRNGTYLNGDPIPAHTPTTLWPGVYIGFGEALYSFVDGPTLRRLAKLSEDSTGR